MTDSTRDTGYQLTPEFAAAFVAACGELVDVDKGKTADAGNYGYRYADLAAVLADVRPVLARHGLAVVQDVESAGLDGGGVAVLVRTVVVHTSAGVYRSPTLRLTAPPDPQRVGSAITYARRYSLMATLGIAATDDDDDAASAKPAAAKDATRTRGEVRKQKQQPAKGAPPQVRSVAELSIREMLAAATPEVRKRVQAAFKQNYGMILTELPTEDHEAALNFVINQLDPDRPENLDAVARAEADAAHAQAEQPDEPATVTPGSDNRS